MIKWTMGLHTAKPNRMWVAFPYDPLVVEAIKTAIPGVRWDAEGKVWHAPLDMDVARDIRRLAVSFSAGLEIREDLATWAKAQKAREAALIRPDDTTTDQSTMLPVCRANRPELIEAMESKPWQIPGASFVASQKKVILADQPGLGKTLQTLAAVIENDVRGPILVVAPKTAVVVTWPDEIAQWLGEGEVVYTINADLSPPERRAVVKAIALNAKDYPDVRQWVLMGPNYLRIRADVDEFGNFKRDAAGRKIVRAVNEAIPELFAIQWSAVIVDESHQVTAGGSPGIGKHKWSAQRLGLDCLQIAPNGMRIAISGTPFRGKTEYMFGTLQWLHPEKYTSYWNWVKRHYGVVSNDHANRFGSGIAKGDRILMKNDSLLN